MKEVHDAPSEAEANHGLVAVKGPDAVDVVMTPKAALRTAERISSAAVEALVEQNLREPGDRH